MPSSPTGSVLERLAQASAEAQVAFSEIVLGAALRADWTADRLATFLACGRAAEEPEAARRRRVEGALAVVPIRGLLTWGAGWWGTSYQEIATDVTAAASDPKVGAIVLDVASPGGGVYGAQETADAIRGARAQKRIIASVGPEAASAAYWLASQADEIVVTPSGQVGSVGVFAMHVDWSKWDEREGVDVSYIVSRHAPYKVEWNSDAPLTDEARAAIQERVDAYEADFVRMVAAGRRVTQAAVHEHFGQGRMLRAQAAVDRKMADRVGTLETVVRDLQGAARETDAAWRASRRAALEAAALHG